MDKTYVFDLDGTLANCDHRVQFAETGQWDEFHSRCSEDLPHQEMFDLYAHLSRYDRDSENELGFIVLTGRNEKYRTPTIEWLAKHGMYPEALLMRGDEDFRKDIEMKLEHLDQYFGSRERALAGVAMIFEDRDKLVEGLRLAGFKVLQVRQSTY